MKNLKKLFAFATFIVIVALFSSCSQKAPVDKNPESTWAQTAEFFELQSAGMVTITFKKVKVNNTTPKGTTTYQAIDVVFPNNEIMDLNEDLSEVSIRPADNELKNDVDFLFFEMETDFGSVMAYAGPDDQNFLREVIVPVNDSTTATVTFLKVRSVPYVFKKDVPASFLMQGKKFVKYNAGYVQKSTISATKKVVHLKDDASAPPPSDEGSSGGGWIKFLIAAGITVSAGILLWKFILPRIRVNPRTT